MMPREECESLLNAMLPAAEDLLSKNSEFYPIGAVLTADSDIAITAVDSGDEFPDSQCIIDALIVSHRQMAENNEIKASGIAWNAVIADADGEQSDAIIVSLEHRDDYCVIVGLPYEVGLSGDIRFGEIFAQNGNHDVF